MKIAIDISQLVYGTGVSVYTENLVKSLVNKYTDVDWVLFGGSLRKKSILEKFVNELGMEGVIKTFPPKLSDLVWNRLHVCPIENWIGKVDLIHTSDWSEPPSIYPKVTTIHDLVPLKYPETTTSLIKNTHTRKLFWVKKESKKILAVSKATKQDIIKTLNIDSDKIVVTYQGADEIYYPREINEINKVRHKYRLDNNYLFFLSTLEPRKNYQRLIGAFQMVRKVNPNLKLLLAGKSGWGKKIHSGNGIVVPGYVPTKDLPALFSGCTAYVLPSLYEGFGVSLLQAMSCGAPVITSNVSSMPEIVGKSGILVNPKSTRDIANGIHQAIKKGSNLSKKSLKRAKAFSWDNVVEKTFHTYLEAIDGFSGYDSFKVYFRYCLSSNMSNFKRRQRNSNNSSGVLGLIHAGGGGTRLKNKGYSKLDNWPKILLDIPYQDVGLGLKRATMFDRTVLELDKSGFNNFLCLISYDNNTDVIRQHINEFYDGNDPITMHLKVYKGSSKEGAARSSYLAIKEFDLNGLCYMTPPDTLFPFNKLPKVVKFHKKRKADITWTVTSIPDKLAQNPGRIIVDNNGYIIGSNENGSLNPLSTLPKYSKKYTSTGVFVIDTKLYLKIFKEFIEEHTDLHRPLDLWRDVIAWSISKGYAVLAYDIKEPAPDLGEIHRLKAAGGL